MAYSAPQYSNTGKEYDKYGFDCVFVTEPPTKFFCPICVMILRDPYQTQCCGGHYCQCCVQQLVHKSTPCVSCGGVVRAFRDVSVTQKINALRVKCSNADWGCGWVGELGYLGEHLVACELKPAKCTSCGLFVPNDTFRKHQSQDCPKRAYTCQYCSNFTSTYEKVRSTHWPQCPSFPIECPNGCSSTNKIPRDKILSHLKEDCRKLRDMSDTIDLLELALEQKERRMEELETELQGSEQKASEKLSSDKNKKSTKNIFKRKGSRPFDDVGKEAIEELSERPRGSSTEDPKGLIDSGGKERNFEQEVKLLKECIAEKVSQIEELRMRISEQCASMANMEEDFSTQLKAMKNMCQKLREEKESLEQYVSKEQGSSSSEDRFSQLI